MVINWQAILAGLAGGVVAAFVADYAITQVLDAASGDHSTTQMAWTAGVALLGGVVGTVLGWLANGRRAAGLTGIAAIVSVVGAVVVAASWMSAVAPAEGRLFVVVGAIILLGVALVSLVAVCGLTVAVLKPASRPRAVQEE